MWCGSNPARSSPATKVHFPDPHGPTTPTYRRGTLDGPPISVEGPQPPSLLDRNWQTDIHAPNVIGLIRDHL